MTMKILAVYKVWFMRPTQKDVEEEEVVPYKPLLRSLNGAPRGKLTREKTNATINQH
jgi:hypothetical protein